ncbi:hypothetical protein BRC78_00490 [Halobacteriales archaeon QH_8_68_33]|nr:MAG: hypothetical protein BRC78_00490 [Halobacteriales archaeon QH_8_68_33]
MAILDGDAILLGRVPVPDRNLWATPGGMVEAGEDLDIAGARELDEETGLTVDPDDLVLFDARTLVKFEATHKTSLRYAVDAGDAAGTPAALDEIGTNVPEAHADLSWWVEEGRAALERAK